MSIPESTCKFLFGQEANEIFSNLKFVDSQDKEKFVERCLDLTMRVNVYILTRKEGFFLIDPMTFNNQCHLYAFRAAQIMKNYPSKTEEEKLAKTEENRLLHLSFFLSFPLLSHTALFIKTAQKALKEMGETAISPKKKFEAFLRDEGKCREKAARKALNAIFENSLKETLALTQGESPLHADLFKIAHENLQLQKECMGRHSPGTFYTYPKFAGVVHMVDCLAKEKIAFVMKVKVITAQGTGTIMQASDEIREKDPVIIFEAVATDGLHTIPYIKEEARRCPTYFYQHPEKNKLHPNKADCFFCKTTPIDLEPFRRHLQAMMRVPADMLHALGAHFTLNVQHDFQSFFNNQEKYPQLSSLFQEAISKMYELGLASSHPQAFSMCHVHVDTAAQAFSANLQLDASPEVFLKQRGIV